MFGGAVTALFTALKEFRFYLFCDLVVDIFEATRPLISFIEGVYQFAHRLWVASTHNDRYLTRREAYFVYRQAVSDATSIYDVGSV
jgi:hypothetical protein